MKPEERRKAIVALLLSEQKPITGGDLANQFQISRQIIVQDINALKASGYDILATHHGYRIQNAPYFERIFQVHHNREDTHTELNTIVDFGGMIVDVFVLHKIYGKLVAKLNITTRQGISEFLDGIQNGTSTELMSITGGRHYHTVRADSEETLNAIEHALRKKGFLV